MERKAEIARHAEKRANPPPAFERALDVEFYLEGSVADIDEILKTGPQERMTPGVSKAASNITNGSIERLIMPSGGGMKPSTHDSLSRRIGPSLAARRRADR